MCLVDGGADGEVLESDMNAETDRMEVFKRDRPVVEIPNLACAFCKQVLTPQWIIGLNRHVVDHGFVSEYLLESNYFDANFFCPNNAKIWLLGPDMVTLKEI